MLDEHVERRLKVLRSTSASAIDRWRQCRRQWFGGYVEGIWTEPSAAQKRGTAIDLEVQHHYKGEPVDARWRNAVIAIVKLLPPSPVIQLKIELPTYPGGPLLIGYPDFLYEVGPRARVLDLKSLSDWRYAKTAEQLRTNTQMVIYSVYLWTLEVEVVEAGHIGAKFVSDKKSPTGYRFQGARLSELASMERDRIQAEWVAMHDEVRAMVAAAIGVADFHALPPTGASDVDEYGKNACERFQGCNFRNRCGLDALGGPKIMSVMTLSERLAQMNAMKQGGVLTMAGVPAPAAATEVSNPNHAHPGDVLPKDAGYQPGQPCNGKGHYASSNGQGFIPVEPGHKCSICLPAMVVPPDAPPRTSTPAQIVEAEAKKRGRPKKSTVNASDDVIEMYGKLSAAGYTTDQIGKLVKSGEAAAIIAKLEAATAPAADATVTSSVVYATAYGHPIASTDVNGQAYATLEARGFTMDEANYLNSEGMMEDGMSGKVTPGMMRQPPNAESSGPTIAPSMILPGDDAATRGQKIPAAILPGEMGKGPQVGGGQVINGPGGEYAVTGISPNSTRAAAQAQVSEAVASRRKASPKLPLMPPIIFVDSFASKATGLHASLGLSDAVDLADWLAPVAELAAMAHVDDKGNSAPLDHWSLAPYARGRGLLAAAIREALPSLPAVVLVDTSLPGADVFLEQVKPHAALVVEPRGSRR